MSESYLPAGLPQPQPAPDGLDAPFWEGLGNDEIRIQHCRACEKWQWGPEWICHHCHSDDLSFRAVAGHGVIYSYERVWHPVHPALRDHGPYLVVLVELDDAPGVRLVGNLLGDAEQALEIGAPVRAVFEHHRDADPSFTLLQWVTASH